MTKQSVSFLISATKVGQLDALATSKERDRSFVLNEAVDLYLDLHKHHAELIEKGIADFEAERTRTHDAVGKALELQRQRRRSKVTS